jgi:manganese/zinc/iron transport system substrate-binding protein
MRPIFSTYLPTVFFIAILVVNINCTNPSQNSDAGKIKVVTTTGMIADLVKNIGGDSIEVESLMGPGVDPHLYKATQGDMVKLRNAQLIFYNGLHLEGKMGEVLENFKTDKEVVAIGSAVDEKLLLSDPNYSGVPDPHIWFDVSLWSSTIDHIVEKLSAHAPAAKTYFEQNARSYSDELNQLHRWVSSEIAGIPAENRILITAHDAFHYFGRAYAIEVRGLQGISTLSEFGLRDRVDLVNYIIQHNIKAVFVETSVSEKNIKSIVEGCRQKGHEVTIGGNLYSDAMGKEGTPEGTYIGMVRANVKAIVEALQ